LPARRSRLRLLPRGKFSSSARANSQFRILEPFNWQEARGGAALARSECPQSPPIPAPASTSLNFFWAFLSRFVLFVDAPPTHSNFASAAILCLPPQNRHPQEPQVPANRCRRRLLLDDPPPLPFSLFLSIRHPVSGRSSLSLILSDLRSNPSNTDTMCGVSAILVRHIHSTTPAYFARDAECRMQN
jgi:hypothetical protein